MCFALLQVVGLANAYHGDTLGAADCVAPSVFNGRLQAPWYQGRGLFLEPPYLGMVRGRWQMVTQPAWLTGGQSKAVAETAAGSPGWQDLDEVLAPARDDSALTHIYRWVVGWG
jgi:dethiobiotin synthetase/adenosylmethionine--8-amino-7-oxononanoate aminotransferase